MEQKYYVMKRISQPNEKNKISEGDTLQIDVPFFIAPNGIIDIEGKLTAYEKLTYLILGRYGNRGTVAFPSYNTIGRKGGFSKDTAIRAVKGLFEKGYITKINTQSESGGHTSNRYTVNYNFEGVVAESNKGSGREQQGVVAESDSMNKYVYKEIKESALSKSSQTEKPKDAVNEVINYYSSLYHQKNNTKAAVTKSNWGTVAGLIKENGVELVKKAITLHVTEPDQWTRENGGSTLGTFEHNLPGYLERINKRQAADQQQERSRVRIEESRRQHEEEDRKRAEYEALPEAEKQRMEEESRQMLRGIKEQFAARAVAMNG